MRLLLITAGSRGDVEPFAALARRASAAGHTVVLVAPDASGADLTDVEVRSLGVDYSAVIRENGVSPLTAMARFGRVVRPVMRGVIVNAARAALDGRPDVIVAHPKVLSAGLIAARLGIPHHVAELVPALSPTAAFPAVGTVTRDLGPLNRLTYRAAGAAAGMFARELAEARTVLGLPAAARPAPPASSLVPVSPVILERPDDWPATTRLTGPWIEPERSSTLDPAVAAFLDAGPRDRTVLAGFGSMAAGDAERRGRAIVEGARRCGRRVLIVTGWGGIAVPERMLGDDVLVVEQVPHAAVLPRVHAVLHHGGVGTVHAVARAGAVSIVAPFIADQPFWAQRLHRQGLAPTPLRSAHLTAEAVAEALGSAERLDAAAASAARRMRGEDGLGEALGVVERSIP